MNIALDVQAPELSTQEERGGRPKGQLLANRIFGYQSIEQDAAGSPRLRFEGALPVQPAAGKWRSQLQLFATPGTHLRTYVSAEHGSTTYVWGVPSHTEIARAEIAAWCADVVARKEFDLFGDLLGTFVVVVDESREKRVTFISDALGIRPLFIGRHQGRLVFGSDVWAMQEAGLTSGEIDYAAVASWIAYGYACTGGSLFTDLRRLPPGAALVLGDGCTTEIPYTRVNATDRTPSTAQAAEEMHAIVSATAAALLKGQPPLSLPLSGGFDSRYLLALSLELKAPVERIVNVNFNAEEAEVSHRVAEILKVPLEDFPVTTSVWDLYDQVHHFMADGLPISKFVTHKVAERYPGMPMINGYLGGIIIRGFDDVFGGKHESEWGEDPVTVIQRNFLLCDLALFRGDIARRIRERSREPLDELAKKGASTGKIMDWTNMYNRQRYLASNNYLQHLGLTEAVLPFYSWPLVRYKMEHPYDAFNDAVYDTIFRNYYPALAGVPHSDYLRWDRLKKRQGGIADNVRRWRHGRWKVAKCTTKWARQLLPVLFDLDSLNLLAKDRCMPLAVLALSTAPSQLSQRVAPAVEGALLMFQRLHLLETRIKAANLEFDWNRL